MGSGSLFWQERDRPFINGVDLEDARKICRSTTFDNISLAMLDALRAGTLNETQQKIVQALRTAILAIDVRTATGGDGNDDLLSKGE